jgi:hypothetical protein
MNKIWSTLSLIILMTLNLDASSQNAEMADIMRDDGKIYVVVGVIILIFSVLFTYLISIDYKLRKMEKEQQEK